MDTASILPKLFDLKHCLTVTAAMCLQWLAERIAVTYDFSLNNIWIMIDTLKYCFLHQYFIPLFEPSEMLIHTVLATSMYTAFSHQPAILHLQTCTCANPCSRMMPAAVAVFFTRDEQWKQSMLYGNILQ